jgi:hypothetical protein
MRLMLFKDMSLSKILKKESRDGEAPEAWALGLPASRGQEEKDPVKEAVI